MADERELPLRIAPPGDDADRAWLADLWRTALPSGFWLPVAPGTMRPTVGGCIAMNVHGKNHFVAGAKIKSTDAPLCGLFQEVQQQQLSG